MAGPRVSFGPRLRVSAARRPGRRGGVAGPPARFGGLGGGRAQPVALVFAPRGPVWELAGVPELQLRGLSDRDARGLFSSALRGPFNERVSERIVVETKANTRSLLSLPRW